MRLRLLISVLGIALSLSFVTAGSAKEHFVFYGGFGVGGFCDGSGVNRPEHTVSDWTATFDVKKGMIEATIRIKSPFYPSAFVAKIVQGPQDCRLFADQYSAVFELPDGNATIRLSEPITGDFAFIHVDQISTHPETGEWLEINSSYATQTFRH